MRDVEPLVRRHLAMGWWTLAVFLLLGLALEGLHGFKVRMYLDVDNESRRLMWRLAHTHGGLVGVLHIAFAFTGRVAGRVSTTASRCLIAATVLLPGGFLLGGVFVRGGDPNLAILLVPPGALLLLVAVVSAALSLRARPS